MEDIKISGYFVFLHDFDNKWDCVGEFKTYGEAVECTEEYRKYGEVEILTNVWNVIKEVLKDGKKENTL